MLLIKSFTANLPVLISIYRIFAERGACRWLFASFRWYRGMQYTGKANARRWNRTRARVRDRLKYNRGDFIKFNNHVIIRFNHFVMMAVLFWYSNYNFSNQKSNQNNNPEKNLSIVNLQDLIFSPRQIAGSHWENRCSSSVSKHWQASGDQFISTRRFITISPPLRCHNFHPY